MTTKNLFTKPKFQTSSLCFEFCATYKNIVSSFAKQNAKNDGDKTDAEWQLMTETGIYFTIYNYKNGKNYLGEEGELIKDITDWHVGISDDSKSDELYNFFKSLGLIS